MKFALLIGVLTAGFGAGALRAGGKPPADCHTAHRERLADGTFEIK
jgi:hypothetical protein